MIHQLSINLFLIFVLLTATCLSQAVSPPPPELTTLKTRYQSALQTTREPIRAKYIGSLGTLLRSVTKEGNLDAALAVQQELNAVTGKAGTAANGKITPELTALKAQYEADVQTASEALQTRYIASLVTLQDALTKRGKLNDALAVRQELDAAKHQGAAIGATPSLGVSPSGSAPDDVVQPGAVWLTDVPTNGITSSLTITERQGETFKGRYEWPGMKREFTGTVKDGKLSWLSKDVRTVRGNPGWDNFGTIQGDKIDFVARSADGKTATFSMHKKTSRDK